jgi:hypothetical protein
MKEVIRKLDTVRLIRLIDRVPELYIGQIGVVLATRGDDRLVKFKRKRGLVSVTIEDIERLS